MHLAIEASMDLFCNLVLIFVGFVCCAIPDGALGLLLTLLTSPNDARDQMWGSVCKARALQYVEPFPIIIFILEMNFSSVNINFRQNSYS